MLAISNHVVKPSGLICLVSHIFNGILQDTFIIEYCIIAGKSVK